MELVILKVDMILVPVCDAPLNAVRCATDDWTDTFAGGAALRLERAEKRYQIFVSSTYEDLKEARQEVIQALLELDCIPSGMELFPAADETQWRLIQGVIDSCDYYLVILAGRYGSVNKKNGKSFTQIEYEYALRAKKPVIAFLHSNLDSIPAKYTEQDPEKKKLLDAFRELTKKKVVKGWLTPQDLGGAVSRSIVNLIRNNPAVGWVRADSATHLQRLETELHSAIAKVESLETRLLPQLKSDQAAFLKELGRTVKQGQRDAAFGLTRAYFETKDFKYQTLINEGRTLDVVMNDGQVWLSRNEDYLIERFRDSRKTSTFIFVHPESPVVDLLAQKTSVEPHYYKRRIRDSVAKIRSLAPANASVRILGHRVIPHLAVFANEHRAYVTLYTQSSLPVPSPSGLEVARCDGDCYYSRLIDDLRELSSISVDISRA